MGYKVRAIILISKPDWKVKHLVWGIFECSSNFSCTDDDVFTLVFRKIFYHHKQDDIYKISQTLKCHKMSMFRIEI